MKGHTDTAERILFVVDFKHNDGFFKHKRETHRYKIRSQSTWRICRYVNCALVSCTHYTHTPILLGNNHCLLVPRSDLASEAFDAMHLDRDG